MKRSVVGFLKTFKDEGSAAARVDHMLQRKCAIINSEII